MRRPTFCHNSVAAVEAEAPPRSIDKEETRLSRMKRMLTGSLLLVRPRASGAGALRAFGVHLDQLPLTSPDGLPAPLLRITTFIDKYGLQMEGLFRLSGGNPKLVEQLKLSFDRSGDADLEGCGDVTSVAALLRLWLRDLPEPVVPAVIVAQLISLLQKCQDDVGGEDWCVEARVVLTRGGLKERNGRVLRCVLHLLHRYQLRHGGPVCAQSLASVFAPLLLSADDRLPRIATPDTAALTATLITSYPHLYNQLVTDVSVDGGPSAGETTRLFSAAGKNKSTPTPVINDVTSLSAFSGNKKHRKRKDRHGADLQGADRKFVRSNSEERPCKSSSLDVSCGGATSKDSIRRVSSHEDFSRSRGGAGHVAPRHAAHLMELISETAACIQMSRPTVARPLHERNSAVVVVRSAGNSVKNNINNNNNHNNNNNNNHNNNNNKAKNHSTTAEYNNNNNAANNNSNNGHGQQQEVAVGFRRAVLDEAWHAGVGVRRDESLAPTVVCSPPPGDAALLLDESEHEKRRHSERFAPLLCSAGVTRNNGHGRRRKTAAGVHRRRSNHHRRSGGGCSSDDTDGGGSSSKENEEECSPSSSSSSPFSAHHHHQHQHQQQHDHRRSTLMMSPAPALSSPRLPPPPQASFSGEESSSSSSSDCHTPGTLSRSTSGSLTRLNPQDGGKTETGDEQQSNSVAAAADGGDECVVQEEEKDDVEELEEEVEDGGEEEGEGEGEEEEEDDGQDPTRLDLSRLHRNVDSCEPLPSRHDWSFAPQLPQPQERAECDGSSRNSATFAAGHRAFAAAQAVSAAAAATPADQLPLSGRSQISIIEQHHAKQIQTLKKRLKRYEEGFEREFGYKPSSADKMANPDTKKMCLTLSKLRRELKQLKTEASLCPSTSMSQLLFLSSGDRVTVASANASSKAIKEDVVHDLEKRLNEKRLGARRPNALEEMTREQLADEKAAVQRALLQLEAAYGRPATREQRDLVRPLYDRYRSLKRLLARAVAAAKLKEGVAELGTILEHEQMDFSSSSPPPPPPPIVPVPAITTLLPVTSSDVAVGHNGQSLRPTTPDLFENLHALPRSELLEQHKITREEKKRLRRQLHEFEDEFESKTGRKLLKEDRLPMDALYTEYKHIKAKLRLIEALITKK